MSLLYGDDSAALTLATWSRSRDPHWFGANIPGELIHLEKIRGDSLGKLKGSLLPAAIMP